jgi:phosphatidylinositol alpha-1,6-mannosyltransferase
LFLVLAMMAAILGAARQRPRMILAGSGLVAPIAWIAARCCGSSAVVYVHGLDLIVESFIYRVFWLPFIRRMDGVFVNSQNTKRIAISLGVPLQRLMVLNPGTDLPAFDAQARTRFRAANGLGDAAVLLSVGRLTPRKGMREFVLDALPELISTVPGLLLVIIGEDATDGLNYTGGSERQRIVEAAVARGVGASVRFLPRCTDAQLSEAYFGADLHVFPIRESAGDVEGFGMVAVEAAAHGLPTVGFRCGGVPDAVLEGVTGQLVAPTDYAALVDAICRWLALARQSNVRENCRHAAARWSWAAFGQSLHGQLEPFIRSGGRTA